MKPCPIVLVVDPDKAVRRLLRNVLEPEGYRVSEVEAGTPALRAAAERKPDLLILDVALPDDDGLEVLRRLREWNQAPILVLSERDSDADKVLALDNGADDFLAKPFSSRELLARLRVLRRPLPGVPEGPFLIEGDFTVNITTHEVTFREAPIRFTPTEEALFHVLVRYAGKVVTTAHLLRSVWGAQGADALAELRVYIERLRRKLEPCGPDVQIVTHPGVGYALRLQTAPRLVPVSLPS